MEDHKRGRLQARSLAYFCRFVAECTRLTEYPTEAAAACEFQAEFVRITRQDLNLATIDLLLDTMLTAIEHLETKWLEEQRQRAALERKLWRNWLKHLCQKGIRHVWQRCRLRFLQSSFARNLEGQSSVLTAKAEF